MEVESLGQCLPKVLSVAGYHRYISIPSAMYYAADSAVMQMACRSVDFVESYWIELSETITMADNVSDAKVCKHMPLL